MRNIEPARFSAPADGRLTPAMHAAWERDGFLILEKFASRSDCAQLIARADALVDAFEPSGVASIFTTNEQTRATDRYFLESAYDIRFFFEEEAFDAAGQLRQAKSLSINKIGHALHDLDPVFSDFSHNPRLDQLAHGVGLRDPRLMQSMYIFKQPHIGGEVTCHQDSTFLYTEPMSVVGFWFALQDARLDNGCLWALPGGHKSGLTKKFHRTAPGAETVEIQTLKDPAWPPFAAQSPYVPIEAETGTLVLLHGLLPHLSCANRSAQSRHAYTLHAVDGAAYYPPDNWLQRPKGHPARGFELETT